MNQIKYLILLVSLILSACESDKDPANKTGLEVVSSDLFIEASGGNSSLKILSTENWKASSNKSWCTLTPNGTTLTVSVSENPGLASRTAQITLTTPQDEKTIPVHQQGSIIALSRSQVSLGAQGQAKIITVQSNYPWQAEAEDNWCRIQRQNDTLIISAAPQTESQIRTTHILLTAGKNQKKLQVSQRYPGGFVLDKWSDTDLGATLPSTEENLTGPDYRNTWGDFYQWGRNVAFPRGTAFSSIPTNPGITVEAAQNMKEFIGSDTPPFDWLTDGSRTTFPTTSNAYTWKDRAGSEPCPPGWRLPRDYEARQVFPPEELAGRYFLTERKVDTEILDQNGTEYTCVSIGDGESIRYAIKKFGTNDAYVLRYEWKVSPNGNQYLKITEIQGDSDTDFSYPEEAAQLFAQTGEFSELFLTAGGYLYCDSGGINSEGNTCSYWTASPFENATAYISAGNFQVYVDASYCPRALGCTIRCIKDE